MGIINDVLDHISYLHSLCICVKVIPLHAWAVTTFWSIGACLGIMLEVDDAVNEKDKVDVPGLDALLIT